VCVNSRRHNKGKVTTNQNKKDKVTDENIKLLSMKSLAETKESKDKANISKSASAINCTQKFIQELA